MTELFMRSRLSEGGGRRAGAPFGTAAAVMLAVLLFAGASPRSAQGGDHTHSWTGDGDGTTWTDPDNWDPEEPPDGAGDVVLISLTDHDITIPAGLVLGGLTLAGDYAGAASLAGNLEISGDLSVNNGTLRTGRDVVSGIEVVGTFAIGPDGTVVVRRSSTAGEGAGQTIIVQNLVVDGNLHADGEGFNRNSGPGRGGGGDGGSHGGRGSGGPVSQGTTYGSMTGPTSLGSGGAHSSWGGAGGGAVIIEAAGAVTVNGVISANGEEGSTIYEAGSGGSVNISAANLYGDGVIRANGAIGVRPSGGGGGRVAVAVTGADEFTGLIRADGGGDRRRGHAGTVHLSQQRRDNLVLGGSGNIQTLRLGTDDNMGPGGDYNYEFGTITIEAGGRLEMDGNPFLNQVDGVRLGASAVIIASELDVKEGGHLSGDHLGFRRDAGPGHTAGDYNSGASHGGRGGGNPASVGITYGSMTDPISLGSGAHDLTHGGGGGGAVIVAVSGPITVDGVISADGQTVTRSGAGGSVNITAAALYGSGEIRANGGASSSHGSGGGGRVAIAVSGADAFTGAIRADGGGSGNRGHAGTIRLPEQRRNNLVLGGSGSLQTLRLGTSDDMGPGGDYNYEFGTITIEAGGRLEIDTNPRLNEIEGRLHGTSAVLTVSDLEVGPGGVISADRRGFRRSNGPGVGGSEDGGSHGGRGGGTGGTGSTGPTYGSPLFPTALGSSGQSSTHGGEGGGAVIIEAAGAVIVLGEISACGQDANRGGAGGTINIAAAALHGDGKLSVNGGTGTAGGGAGGRIAVVLSDAADFAGIVFEAFGGTGGTHAAAGTIYLQHAGHAAGGGTLYVRNQHETVWTGGTPVATELPPALGAALYVPELARTAIAIRQKGKISLTTDLTVGDISLKE